MDDKQAPGEKLAALVDTLGGRSRSTIRPRRPRPFPATSSPAEPPGLLPATVAYWRAVQAAGAAATSAADQVCATCRGVRWVRPEAGGRLVHCPQCKPATVEELYRASGLTERERDWTLARWIASTPERRLALEAVETLVAKRRGWVTLWGPFGPGKSFLGAAAVNAYVAAGNPARFLVLASWLRSIKDTFGRGKATEPDERAGTLFDLAASAGLLVMDECHAFAGTPWESEQVRDLVTTRYRMAGEQATIWILNAEPQPGAAGLPGELDFLYSKMREWPVLKLSGDMRSEVRRARAAKEEAAGAQAPLPFRRGAKD